jgi:hypothetical protein
MERKVLIPMLCNVWPWAAGIYAINPSANDALLRLYLGARTINKKKSTHRISQMKIEVWRWGRGKGYRQNIAARKVSIYFAKEAAV